jgi:hypothetical protein
LERSPLPVYDPVRFALRSPAFAQPHPLPQFIDRNQSLLAKG